jgi:hypothetical protein
MAQQLRGVEVVGTQAVRAATQWGAVTLLIWSVGSVLTGSLTIGATVGGIAGVIARAVGSARRSG